MPKAPPVIILIVSTSFGEIDWILPALTNLKERFPEWEVITLFSHKLLYQYLTENRALYTEFCKVSSLYIVPQELDALFSQQVKPDQVKIILKDYNQDQYAPYKLEVMARCPKALVVSYPHSNHIYSNQTTDPIQHCSDPDTYSRHDIFLLNSDNDIPFWSKDVDINKIKTLGYPRYDSWWIDRFLASPSLSESMELKATKQADHVFFFISRGPHSHYLSQQDYEYLVKSTMESVLQYDNSLLLIKPHPRQDISDLRSLLNPYEDNRWLISGLHLFQLASLADVVISGWSSGILDALAVKKPVIEFWRFGGQDPLCRKTADGHFTTIYEELGLAAPAKTKAELKTLLSKAISDPQENIWQQQLKAFHSHCKLTDQASQAIADCLLQNVETKEASGVSTDNPQQQQELIETLIEYVVTMVEENTPDRARQWLDFLAAQFPKDARIFNTTGVFLFNQGDFTGAVDNLVQSLNLDPTSHEAAINLTQILLAIDREDDAINIVLGFYRQVHDEQTRNEFLHTLHRDLGDESFTLIRTRLAALRDHT